MQVKSIAECSKGSILQYFWPSSSYNLSLRSLFCLFLSDCSRPVTLYLTLSLWLRWAKKDLLSLFCECADMGILYGRNPGKLTIKAPCTPLPLKFGAYSDRSIVRNHSMTLWFVHKTTSPGTLYRFPWKQSKYNIFSNNTDFIFDAELLPC